MSGQVERAEKLEEENNELKIELLSLEEHLKSVISDFESYRKITVERNSKTEDFAKSILQSFGYEIE